MLPAFVFIQRVFRSLAYNERRVVLRELARIVIADAANDNAAKDIAVNIAADVMSVVAPPQGGRESSIAAFAREPEAQRVHVEHNPERGPHRRRQS